MSKNYIRARLTNMEEMFHIGSINNSKIKSGSSKGKEPLNEGFEEIYDELRGT